MRHLKSRKGQSLVEYLVIVAIVGVGSIAIMRSVGQNVQVRFAHVVRALGGQVEGNRTADAVQATAYKKKDLKSFARGSLEQSRSGKDQDDAE